MRAISNASPSFPEWMSAGAADFIRCALQRTAARRSSIAQLLQHPWVLAHTRQRLISEGDAMLAAEVSYTSSMTASSTSSAYSIASLPGALNAGQQQVRWGIMMLVFRACLWVFIPCCNVGSPNQATLQACCGVCVRSCMHACVRVCAVQSCANQLA